MTTIIKQDDLITSIKDALQFISYYHPQDFIQAMSRAYDREKNKAAKDAIAQILINSRMCAEGHRPICQDTGIVNVFLEVGLDVKFDLTMSLDDAINEGVRQGYLENSNVLRASVLADPAFGRKNTKDNTPAVIHYKLVPGNKVDITVAAKGGGSENKSKLAMLNPSDSNDACQRSTHGRNQHGRIITSWPTKQNGRTPYRDLRESERTWYWCTRFRRLNYSFGY
ncbi:Fumarate hydratase class I, anaerobic [Mycobacteroides abscessus subsp. abscessus]|nr:Fumarate hydratase class I, anaerobic [Mycobacteroides abscessus subsp. abscessus]